MRLDDITILVPVRDDCRIERCLASIDVGCPVVVALNGATPEFAAWVRRACPQARVVATDRPGLGGAYNLGLARCDTDYVLLMDSDCTFAPGAIAALRRGLRTAVLAKGTVVFADGGSGVSRTIAAYRTFHTADRLSAFSPPLALSRAGIMALLGRYFDEGLAWAEDLDFDARVQARGIRIAACPDAVVIHPPLTLAEDLRAAFRYGTGYSQGMRRGLFPPPPRRSRLAQMRADLVHAREVRAGKGLAAALYALLWLQAHRRGFQRG
jgi:glycosyltransferase involved in cell wall biosynthesis